MNENPDQNMIDSQIITEDIPNNKNSNDLFNVPLLLDDGSVHLLVPEDGDKKNLILLNVFDPSTKSYKSLTGELHSK